MNNKLDRQIRNATKDSGTNVLSEVPLGDKAEEYIQENKHMVEDSENYTPPTHTEIETLSINNESADIDGTFDIDLDYDDEDAISPEIRDLAQQLLNLPGIEEVVENASDDGTTGLTRSKTPLQDNMNEVEENRFQDQANKWVDENVAG
eukprot:CAMPEP_0178895018 /NCGR_PEP_ID=MMETSP0786-20121207/340_1 /TAXON_ID=186022 /ORGANISM="Thalassionema frauenfeldii, Strain CCMP 1798" /LENGTH=148 /DNA_ID=CAMNT_0020565175 /DNA_START=614 /DNA_END=1060 /DNA_ORIENTATION=+